tara:strand:+ start:327 stop:476 length:150 start_codon:yes stop_codon:yes gene_type:complete
MPDDKVVNFPMTSEVDQQFLDLERQKEKIREQLEDILSLNESFTDRNEK